MHKGLGVPPAEFARQEKAGVQHAGALMADGPGRTDELPITVPSGSFVIPADIVSAVGDGNTMNGFKILNEHFGSPRPKYAAGGGVPIIAAGGEFVVPPEEVTRIGSGDMDKGHDILERMVKEIRATTIKKLQKLPGPSK